MSPEQFTYWLQGFAEIQSNPPTKEQWKIIKDHLALVLTKVTPKYKPFKEDLPLIFPHQDEGILSDPLRDYTPYKQIPDIIKKYEVYC